MSSAKKDFIERIRALSKSIQIESVSAKPLTEKDHNDIARMLRNGLAVVSFAALEDFIKKRSSEAMEEIGRSSVLFSNLPEKLQKAATYESVSSLNYQLGIRDKSQKISYIQEHATKIASTATSNYEITPHAFAYGQANVNTETIKKILLCFHVRDPWAQMTSIASRLSLTALPLVESYKNAASRRHKAAHVATADTPQTDISQFVKEAFAIAISFDCLLSKSLTKIKEHDLNYLNGDQPISAQQLTLRFIQYQDNKWKERQEGASRAYRISNDLAALKIDTKNRAVSAKQIYIEFDETGLINDWECN